MIIFAILIIYQINKAAQIIAKMITKLPMGIFHYISEILNAIFKFDYNSENWKVFIEKMIPNTGKDSKMWSAYRLIPILFPKIKHKYKE